MRRFCLFAMLSVCLLFSCRRPAEKAADTGASEFAQSSAAPMALVQAGEFPLWFQLSATGPVLIETIEDAVLSAALIPWPLALHVRFMLAQGKELSMAVNRDGFLCFSPWGENETATMGLFRFSGGDFWRQYTVGAFFLSDEKPAALLYYDDRFLDSDAPLPSPRLWTFDLYSRRPNALSIPPLDAFAPEDGWNIDTLRRGTDGYWYYRAVKKTAEPKLLMLRSGDPAQVGESVSLGAFQNAALPEPLSAAPAALREMLAAVLSESGGGVAAVISPEFQTTRAFATDREKSLIVGFYSGAFLLAAESRGKALYAEGASINRQSVYNFSLPPLPEGFVYTGIGMCGDTIIASWEEQAGYSIGAAGFMVIKHPLPLLK